MGPNELTHKLSHKLSHKQTYQRICVFRSLASRVPVSHRYAVSDREVPAFRVRPRASPFCFDGELTSSFRRTGSAPRGGFHNSPCASFSSALARSSLSAATFPDFPLLDRVEFPALSFPESPRRNPDFDDNERAGWNAECYPPWLHAKLQ